ncbi:MAG: T9SS type A sorting domain-containing protein, partial [Flavobacteriales bacterium]
GYDNEDQAPNSAASGYYYDITRSNSVNAVLYIEWTDEDQYGTGGNVLNADVTGITFGYYNGSDWDVITSSPTGSISNGNVTSNAFNFAGQYVTLGSLDGENNLPIDLVSFEGECVDNQTNLEFVVASQVNNEYFTIERSKNLLSWEKLGDIVGGGTNNEEITYNFKDISPNSGDNYYRLSQTDIDGTTESFSPIAVTCESKVENYHIYPNPTTNRIAVEFELEFYQGDDIELVIRDFKGSIVKSNSIDLNRGYNYFEVDLSDIPNGIYMISYSGTKNHIPLKRVIKL